MSDGNLVLCGPIVRRADRSSVSVFVATRRPCTVTLTIHANDRGAVAEPLMTGARATIALGPAGGAHVAVVTASAADALVWGGSYYYDLRFDEVGRSARLHDDGVLVPEVRFARLIDLLIYREDTLPGFVLPPADHARLRLLHGSCRKPHGDGEDALAYADVLIAEALDQPHERLRPQQLFLTGDQIYADDVQVNLLRALNAFGRDAIGATEQVVDLGDPPGLAPGARGDLIKDQARLSSGARSCHLVTVSEFYAMHLFAWSLEPWGGELGAAAKLAVPKFIDALPRVRRALANVATYMIFDDHEVTDDWNIRASWADAVLGNSLGRRIIRNGLAAYALFQHWGNDPAVFAAGQPGGRALELLDGWDGHQAQAGDLDRVLPVAADAAGLSSPPPDSIPWGWRWRGAGHEVIALDTRTRRRFGPGDVSLMSEVDVDAALAGGDLPPVTFVLSATPVLGVKFLEWLQAKAARLDWGLKVDDEPWAHGRVYGHLLAQLLARSPVIVLSGDVHFGFGTSLFDRAQPQTRIVNFVSSAVKNMAGAWARRGLMALGFRTDQELQSAAAARLDDLPVIVPTRSTVSVAARELTEELLVQGDAVIACSVDSDHPEVILQGAQNRDRTDITGRNNLGDLHFVPGDHEVVQTLWYFHGTWRRDRQTARFWLGGGR